MPTLTFPHDQPDEGVEEIDGVFRRGGEVAADCAELFGAEQGALAPGHFLSQFDHSNVAFGAVVVGRDPPVVGEAQVVVLAVEQPLGQRVVFVNAPPSTI